MENWARLASPEARDMQVASLLGTTPVAGDPGQPQMLALSKPANATEAPVEMASAEPMLADVATASQVARSEEHTSELQSLMRISYAVFCSKKQITSTIS